MMLSDVKGSEGVGVASVLDGHSLIFLLKKIVFVLWPDIMLSQTLIYYHILKVSSPPTLFFSGIHPLTQLRTPFKIFFSFSSFMLHPLLRYFWQFPLPQTTPSCPNWTHQPSLHIINGFKYQKGILPVQQFNYRFLSKISFWFFPLQIYQAILSYEIFSGSFLDKLEWPFS